MTVRRALDAVGHEHAAQVGLAGDEIAVAAADHLHVHVGHVAVLQQRSCTVARTRPDGGFFLHFDRQRRDQHQAAGVQVVAAADDQVRALLPSSGSVSFCVRSR